MTMLLMVELVLLAATLFYLAWPLLNKKSAEISGGEMVDSELSDLLYRKEAAYIALSDLKFDHDTGKIGEQDYEEMKTRFEAEAVIILNKIDETRNRSAAKGSGAGKKDMAPDDRFCPECGTKIKMSHRFCYKCGVKM